MRVCWNSGSRKIKVFLHYCQLNNKKRKNEKTVKEKTIFIHVVQLVLFSLLPNDGNKFTFRQRAAEAHTKSNMYETNNKLHMKLEMVESIDLHHNYHSSLYCMLCAAVWCVGVRFPRSRHIIEMLYESYHPIQSNTFAIRMGETIFFCWAIDGIHTYLSLYAFCFYSKCKSLVSGRNTLK